MVIRRRNDWSSTREMVTNSDGGGGGSFEFMGCNVQAGSSIVNWMFTISWGCRGAHWLALDRMPGTLGYKPLECWGSDAHPIYDISSM